MLDELRKNVDEFISSAEDNLKKERYNASVSDYFKAIVIIFDYLLYKDMKIISKNHNDRFNLLKKYYFEDYKAVSRLFELYIKSYNLRLSKEDALVLKEYVNGIKKRIID